MQNSVAHLSVSHCEKSVD